MRQKITISVDIPVPVHIVWELWTKAEHISVWNKVDESWHTPKVDIDLRDGGEFLYRMESRDGRHGFDHKGKFDKVIPHQYIEYTLVDGRKTVNTFRATGEAAHLTETFDPEDETPADEQENFCFRVLQTFRTYAESIWRRRTGVEPPR